MMTFASPQLGRPSQRPHKSWVDSLLRRKPPYTRIPDVYPEELMSDLISPKLKPSPRTPLFERGKDGRSWYQRASPPTPALPVAPAPIPSAPPPSPATNSMRRLGLGTLFGRSARSPTIRQRPMMPFRPFPVPKEPRDERSRRAERARHLNAFAPLHPAPAHTKSRSSFPGAWAIQQNLTTKGAANMVVHPPAPVHAVVARQTPGVRPPLPRLPAPDPTPFVDSLAKEIALERAKQQHLLALQQCHSAAHEVELRKLSLRKDLSARPLFRPSLPQAWPVARPKPQQKLVFDSSSLLSLRTPRPVVYEHQTFKTAEHLLFFLRLEPGYHAPEVLKDFLELPDPHVAAGRHPGALRRDWWTSPQLRQETFQTVARAKLEQHAEVERALRETGAWELVDGHDGGRENLLGKTWMELRRERTDWRRKR